KGTDKLRADLRKRISKLKTASQTKKNLSRQESAFRIRKEGAGQVVIIGPANVGKSALVAIMTNATPEVADFPYTTWTPTPGMMPVENMQIQLVDTPPLTKDHVEPEFMDLVRRADVVLLMLDLQNGPLMQFEKAIALLKEHRIHPEWSKKDAEHDPKQKFVPFLVMANKNDDDSTAETFEIFMELSEGDWHVLSTSITSGFNLEALKWKLVERLDIIRVYSKSHGKTADMTAPTVVKRRSTVEDFAGEIHQDFVVKLKSARVWGASVFDGQMVQRDYVLEDGDIVELVI
ncbi:MAG: TGS domain-containing protein, partial [Proteobacteria bacterium]|nr:TGS domain-containing protein [Pseudomonadota bacterium]